MSEVIKAPIIEYSAPHRTFNVKDLYPIGRYLPNPRDWIIKDGVDVIDVCVSTNYADYTYITRDWGIEDDSASSHIKGAINYMSPRMYRFYVDDSKSPPTVNFDGRLGFSPQADTIRIFLGNDISADGDCISGFMRNSVLESTHIPTIEANGLKFPVEGIITRPIEGDNFDVTIVVYKSDGTPFVVDTAQFTKTSYISKADSPSREVLNVELVSPWLSSPGSNVLRFPINLPYDDMLFAVRVTYSDGTVEIPLDGNRAKLVGMKNGGSHDTYYIVSNAGHELSLVFSYRLGANELYRGPDLVENTIVKDYRAVTEAVDGAYSLKLFVVPEWVGGSTGWKLRYYLYDIRRGNHYDATEFVRGRVESTAFDPNLYNVKQKLIVGVNVKDVAGVYKSHQLTQSFHITLIREGNIKGTSYLLNYMPTGDDYGRDVFGLYEYDNVTFTTVNVTCGLASMTEWVTKLYDPIYPLYDRAMESGPLTPTHFVFKYGEYSVTIPIADWYRDINIPVPIPDGGVVELFWIRREAKDDLELGVSSMLVYRKV